MSNIIEPIEFSFMFISPMLYFVHSILAGIAGIVAYFLNIRLDFSFSANISDYILGFNIGNNVLLIIPVEIVFSFFTILRFII
ncbi:hypothetical protein TEHN7118_1912 [Tetragenococcus halophilus subsp. halophilus]|uniref:Uncharacterized protein n=1 Tax=Tetragenococcus halophilus subsp. halophilus TaxID=1513897 RepID=A0A2H6CVU5_TETHA|nr:hypothetical protein TEHN7118_1912 [Tetragenococcus halophilus subsp. halophilus]